MFLIDDILALPIRGLSALCREIADRAQAELSDTTSLRERLTELETGVIGQDEFDRVEADLVGQIEAIERRARRRGAGS